MVSLAHFFPAFLLGDSFQLSPSNDYTLVIVREREKPDNWSKGIIGVKLWNIPHPPERWGENRERMGEK